MNYSFLDVIGYFNQFPSQPSHYDILRPVLTVNFVNNVTFLAKTRNYKYKPSKSVKNSEKSVQGTDNYNRMGPW